METKQTYISPEVSILDVKAEGVLCASIPAAGNGFLKEYDELDW